MIDGGRYISRAARHDDDDDGDQGGR